MVVQDKVAMVRDRARNNFSKGFNWPKPFGSYVENLQESSANCDSKG